MLAIPSDDQERDLHHPLQLMIRSFGPNKALAQHLKEQLHSWVSTGRPFTWSSQGTMEHLHIRAYPAEAGYQERPDEMAMTRGGTQLVFRW